MSDVTEAGHSNPLAKYYRIPGLHVTLPTNGAFMPPGSIEFTQSGDLPIFPMRAADEMLLKSPDALMSGYAIEKLIESCVPGIKAPRQVSAPDLDVLLLAIRAATFGEKMPLTATCPRCGTENDFDCHLPSLMTDMKVIEPENPVRLTDEIVAYVRPYNLENATQMALATFDEARRVQALEGTDVDQRVRTTVLNESYERIAKLNLRMVADCVQRVVVPEGEVTDKPAIAAFVSNVSRSWVAKIDERLREINEKGINKKIDAKCGKCNNEWQTDVEFNPATFFVSGSSA